VDTYENCWPYKKSKLFFKDFLIIEKKFYNFVSPPTFQFWFTVETFLPEISPIFVRGASGSFLGRHFPAKPPGFLKKSQKHFRNFRLGKVARLRRCRFLVEETFF